MVFCTCKRTGRWHASEHVQSVLYSPLSVCRKRLGWVSCTEDVPQADKLFCLWTLMETCSFGSVWGSGLKYPWITNDVVFQGFHFICYCCYYVLRGTSPLPHAVPTLLFKHWDGMLLNGKLSGSSPGRLSTRECGPWAENVSLSQVYRNHLFRSSQVIWEARQATHILSPLSGHGEPMHLSPRMLLDCSCHHS